MCEPEEETLESHNEMCQHNKAWLWLQRRVTHPTSGLPPAAMTVMEMLELYEAQRPAVDAANVGERRAGKDRRSTDRRELFGAAAKERRAAATQPATEARCAYDDKTYFDLNDIAGRRGFKISELPYVESAEARKRLIDWLVDYDSRLMLPAPATGAKCVECGGEGGFHRTACLKHPRFRVPAKTTSELLHIAVCQAVQLLNQGYNGEASAVLRQALVDYADIVEAKPVSTRTQTIREQQRNPGEGVTAVMVSPATEAKCEWCDHPSGYLPPTLVDGKWIHYGRDNDGQLCTAPICTLCEHPWTFSYGSEGSHDGDGHCYFPIGPNASGGQRSCYCKCEFAPATVEETQSMVDKLEAGELYYTPRVRGATGEEAGRAEKPQFDLDPLEFWCDLAEVLGHERPVKVNPATLVAEVGIRLAADHPVAEGEWAINTLLTLAQSNSIFENGAIYVSLDQSLEAIRSAARLLPDDNTNSQGDQP